MRETVYVLWIALGVVPFALPHSAAQGQKKPGPDEKKVATVEEVERHLELADPSKGGNRAGHLKWFATLHPPSEEVKARVARKLVEFALEDKSAAVRGQAGGALPNWATEEVGPKLLVLIKGTGQTEKEGAMRAVGRIRYVKAVPVLIQCIELNVRTTTARNSLIEIGPACEEKVAEMLDKRSLHVVKEALRILDAVGTGKSLPALEKVRNHKEKSVARMAQTAIESVKEREGK